ncbi:hypothetical protein [Candidatus Albibeggiatoa sp. nov. NOAA]|uniref:hypothetical protein n=1 Tax=Candidatus Albibeggiatoa sp. nov. NOAA TaxID=3162724 RepID=UPI003301808C|nr:hypothetical protein [Thiotrichaceae bacterium]
MRYVLGIVLLMLTMLAAHAEQSTEINMPSMGGEVRLPRDVYNTMLEEAKKAIETSEEEIITYAFGKARIIINVLEENDRMTGHVEARIPVSTYTDAWTSIPLLDSDTALTLVSINQQPAQLANIDGKFVWQTNVKGEHVIDLSYVVDTRVKNGRVVLEIPMPSATSTLLEASLPGLQLDPSVSNAVGVTTTESYSQTQVKAHISPNRVPVLSWKLPTDESNYSISRAIYKGKSDGNSIVWEADILMESFTDSEMLLPLLNNSIALHQVFIENEEATIIVDKDKFAVQIASKGKYNLKLLFQTPVQKGVYNGCPGHVEQYTTMQIPKTPISRFHIDIDRQQSIYVVPNSNVSVDLQNHYSTRITTHVPMTGEVAFCWHEEMIDSRPDNAISNAKGYHAIYPEETVLRGLSLLKFNVLQGSSSTFWIHVPSNVLIRSIAAQNDSVLDWVESEADRTKVVVYVDREIDDEVVFLVDYEQAVSTKTEKINVSVPSLLGVTRQSHYVALLHDPVYKLQPEDQRNKENHISKVGQQELPEFFQSRLTSKIRYIYKYHLEPEDDIPTIAVEIERPEENPVIFDAQVSSLISVGEALVEGIAIVDLDVTSQNTGGIQKLRLHLPKMPEELQNLKLDCLGVECVDTRDTDVYGLVMNIKFARPIVETVRLILTYEMNFSWKDADNVMMPIISPEGASVSDGFLAISLKSDIPEIPDTMMAADREKIEQEYLNKPGLYVETLGLEDTGKIWPMQINKLPEVLLQKTHDLKRPVLRAFRYTYLGSHYLLPLKLGRYETTRSTKISEAHYETLLGKQGGVYTQASYEIENTQSQLLEIKLPPDSQLISVVVGGHLDGQARERARTAHLGENSILVGLIKSEDPFSINLQYSYEGEPLGFWGKLEEHLPVLEGALVGHLVWDVYLPGGAYYQVMPGDTNLEVLRSNLDINVRKMKYIFKKQTFGEDNRWVGFSFSQIYSDDKKLSEAANDEDKNEEEISADVPTYSMIYVSTAAQVVGQVISLFSTFLIGSALILFTVKANQMLHIAGILMVSSGTASMVYAIAEMEADMMPTVYVGSIFTVIIVGVWTWQLWTVINQEEEEEEHTDEPSKPKPAEKPPAEPEAAK